MIDGPKKQSEKYFKEFLIIDLNDEPVGVLDLHANHPKAGVCYLGLLLIKEDCFGKGLGRRCYELAEDYIKRALGCSKLRLGVSDANDVAGFWEKQGFTHNGKTYNWTGEAKISMVRDFEKVIIESIPRLV
jgi:GNAT superfamily N-acetyltransferase